MSSTSRPDAGAGARATAWVAIGPLDVIPKLGARVVRSEAHGAIAVFRGAGDEVFALLDACPHRQGPLSQGIVFDRRVACPLHGWTINLEDGTAAAPDKGCVRTFPARVEEGQVLLEL